MSSQRPVSSIQQKKGQIEDTTPPPGNGGGAGPLPGSIAVPGSGIEVRTWAQHDVPDMAEAIAASIEHLRPFLPWIAHEPLNTDARSALVADWEAKRLAGGDAVYGIWRDGRVVGGTGAHRRSGPDGLEIGYWLRADEQGRGTITTVVGVLTSALLALPGITHVEIRHDEANSRSAAIPARCGYRLIGREQRPVEAAEETGWGLLWRIGADPVG
ncbi:MAG: GNAT family N-acetyltransferase [Candidatus Nanopelagicales bacterium]